MDPLVGSFTKHLNLNIPFYIHVANRQFYASKANLSMTVGGLATRNLMEPN